MDSLRIGSDRLAEVDKLFGELSALVVNEPSTISHYFDLYPSARWSFLQAFACVAGHEYGMTPAATPTQSVDELPVVAGAHRSADITSSTFYEINYRAHYETTPIPETLDPRTAFDPEINVTAYADPMRQNGRQDRTPPDMFASEDTRLNTDEYMDISGQMGVAEPLEQAGPISDVQSSQFEPDSLFSAQQNCPARDVAEPEQQLTSRVDAGPTVPPGAWAAIGSIAGPETVAELWSCLLSQRRLNTVPGRECALAIPEIPELVDNSIESQLGRFQLQLQRGNETVAGKHQLLSQVPWRLFLANIAILYVQEGKSRKLRKLVRQDRFRPKTPHARRATVFALFVDNLLPLLLTGDSVTRQAAEAKLDRWLQLGKRWAKPVQAYGPAILLLIPFSLTNEGFRTIGLSTVDDVVRYLDCCRPSLRADIHNLTPFLYSMIENRPLPDQKLYLEMLTESQVASGEHVTQPLEGVFKLTDEYSYFMSEAAPDAYQSTFDDSFATTP